MFLPTEHSPTISLPTKVIFGVKFSPFTDEIIASVNINFSIVHHFEESTLSPKRVHNRGSPRRPKVQFEEINSRFERINRPPLMNKSTLLPQLYCSHSMKFSLIFFSDNWSRNLLHLSKGNIVGPSVVG